MVNIENKENKPTPELEPKDMSSLLYLLITRLGGHIQVEHGVFEKLKLGGVAPIERIYDPDTGIWHFIAVGCKKKPKKRHIITPSKDIVPVRNVI